MRFAVLLRSLPALKCRAWVLVALGSLPSPTPFAAENVYLTDVPDYDWHLGCFGTATGNLMGYWDRHGFPNLYTGPTGAGVAPLTSFFGNEGIRSLWASQAGLDGRPADQPGHFDDYWVDYESTGADPYQVARRTEHSPDCIGDFIGLNQRKWSNLGGECSGNIDGYAFNFFDPTGHRRENFNPAEPGSGSLPDIQSGLRAWARSRGCAADSFSQLSDFNPRSQPGKGFTFADLKAEIDGGYPVLLFMQAFDEFSRTVGGQSGVNPQIHAMLAYGYVVDDFGTAYVRYHTSWASGDNQFSAWDASNWTPNGQLNLPLRGVIGFHPRPRLIQISRNGGQVHLLWEGPMSIIHDASADADQPAHRYAIERSGSLVRPGWETVTGPMAALEGDAPDCCGGTAFYRVRLLAPGE